MPHRRDVPHTIPKSAHETHRHSGNGETTGEGHGGPRVRWGLLVWGCGLGRGSGGAVVVFWLGLVTLLGVGRVGVTGHELRAVDGVKVVEDSGVEIGQVLLGGVPWREQADADKA